MIVWNEYIKTLPRDYDARLAFLKSHPPAPLNWCDTILSLLHPNEKPTKLNGCTSSEVEELLKLGLVDHDVAFKTWHSKQSVIAWPWLMPLGDTPEEAVRYGTREFWFISRQLLAIRQAKQLVIEEIPSAWRSVETQLRTGLLGDIDPSLGLLTLAQMFCAGAVKPPWVLGLSLSDFADTYEMDMAYCDAFRLWVECAFDDRRLLNSFLKETPVPDEWVDWIDEQAGVHW